MADSPRRQRAALWCAFGTVHAWLTWLGVVVVPAAAFWDLDLYRSWTSRALVEGIWPVLDDAWVYPVGAVLPMVLPALGTTTSTVQYALIWCLLVAVLDGAALAVLLRLERGAVAGWWWTAALLLLGPVALGRLDAVTTPLSVVALAVAAAPGTGWALGDVGFVGGDLPAGASPGRRPTVAAALLTVGAWIKVAPGVLLLPLVAAARRPWRDVVLPAALVTGTVVTAVVAGGGATRLTSFITTQSDRGLQVEAFGATPWVLAALVHDDVTIALDPALITYQVQGPGTSAAGNVLGIAMALGGATVAGVLLLARRRGQAAAALLPAALVLSTLLVVANKVGSPQYLTWFVAPMAVLVAAAAAQHRWSTSAAWLVLLASGLTQVVFPWGYPALLTGSPVLAAVLALRNLTLLAVLACGAVGLRRAIRPPAA